MSSSRKISPKVIATSNLPIPRRSPGRPPRFSRQTIIDKTMAMLAQVPAEDITFAKLAQSLDTVPMSLYNYFPNREVLLNEVADHAFSLLQLPQLDPELPWQERLLAWLWAIQRHCAQHPVTFKVLGFEGRLAPGWVRATMPINRILSGLGLRGRPLALASSWFVTDAMGLIVSASLVPVYRLPMGLAQLDELPLAEQELYLDIRRQLASLSGEQWLEFGFRQLIRGVETLLPARPPRTRRSRGGS